MAELVPAPFPDLARRLYLEPQRQNTLFELPRNRWYLPTPGTPDFTVRFHGHTAGNPLGPAAGPHTQMAQNILLSYVAGGRILELKTVQINDRLTLPRPCIDITNIGYNVEWSQELLVEQSLREYVAGSMLIHMFRFAHPDTRDALHGPAGEVIYDTSVGYDLKGIQSEKVRAFLKGMRRAGPMIEELRRQIPPEFKAARDLDYPTDLSDSITLSTFHGCPADEIEKISEFLITEGFHVIVKMNPPMLGKERLEHLLHDVLGYTELTVNPDAYRTGLTFDESVQLCNRLRDFAAQHGRGFGAKFSNTLEVLDHRDFFPPDNKVMYLSGQPLYVITLTLTDEFRKAMGPDFPISFSAGIDQHNFPHAIACGFIPITVSTDLLRPGGYGRMSGYFTNLAAEMRKASAHTIDEYIANWSDQSRDRKGAVSARPLGAYSCENNSHAAHLAQNDPRYRADQNRKIPKRIDSHLVTFDCITCDKCLPVCPNAANFTYPTPKVTFDYHDIIISPNGSWRPGEKRRFEIKESMQIACYSDFCNECGNCDTFCPEYGGPYIKKPTFFGSIESWQHAAPRDGFVIGVAAGALAGRGTGEPASIRGRIKQREYAFYLNDGCSRLDDGTVSVEFDNEQHNPIRVAELGAVVTDHIIDMWVYHTLRHLYAGVRDGSRINQVNAAMA
jgi:putative selenate reductase